MTEANVTSLTTFTIKVEGAALPGSYSVVGIDISREINRIPTAHLILYDGDAAEQKFEISSADELVPGNEIEILVGYDSDETRLFLGRITGQRIEVRRAGDSLLHVEARDDAYRMTLTRRARTFVDLSDADLFETLIGDYPALSADVRATPITHPEIVQYRVSDWDLMVARAETIGLYVLPVDGTVQVAAPGDAEQIDLTLTYGQNIFDLDLEMDARTQPEKVLAHAWDPAVQELLEAEADQETGPAQGNLSGETLAEAAGSEAEELRHSGALQQQEVDLWAEAALLRARYHRIHGTVRFQGNGAVRPGTLLSLAGVGDRFNGTAFVSGVRHIIGDGDWRTTAQIGMPRTWHHERFPFDEPPAAGFRPAVNGLHTGVVLQLQDDPLGEERILVRLPLLGADGEGVWSRLATLDAGSDRGVLFRPEIDDEVVLGFLNDDPHEPVVLGHLHSSSHPAPIPGSDDNHEKGIVTRSGMRLLFNDDTPSVTIETASGNKIVIDEGAGAITIQDEGGSTVTLDADGITLESPQNIMIKADRDVTIEGLNVSIKASAAASVEGSASASLEASGTTTVKGSLVQIN